MPPRLIYRRPLPGHSHLPAIRTDFSQAELVDSIGADNANRLSQGDVIAIGNYAAVDLVAFFEACCNCGNHDAADAPAPAAAGGTPATYGPGTLIIMQDPVEVA